MRLVSTLLLNVGTRVRTWFSRPTVAPSTHAAPIFETAPVAPAPKRKRLNQRHPTLWAAKSSDASTRMWCGPVAVAATIGVDVAEVRDVIKQHRNGKPVKGTYPNELQCAFRHFGYDMTFLADLRGNPPTLATWERERADMEAAYVVMVTGHWVAVRGKWFCDTFTHGMPVKIKDAPRRRKRVQCVYQITVLQR